ncbi:MAG: hypothetical protein CL912_18515 [Deltaproteobacteria bacterium]|nr:hypothetical protein [Deltaproteobacteria bacterium]|tara:strand:+ start:755 stop:1894 length:1140 start_codon:yes stop_codon:yes gene_type:complete
MASLSRTTQFTRLLAIIACTLPALTHGLTPAEWKYARQSAKLAATKFGSKVPFLFTVAEDIRSNIFTDLAACTTLAGTYVSAYECANSVTESALTFGLSAVGNIIADIVNSDKFQALYQTTGQWSKRSTDLADRLLANVPDAVKITDIQILGEPLTINSSSTTLHRRRDIDDFPISVNYTGGLPLTFVMHRPVSTAGSSRSIDSRSSSDAEYVPLFIATDGVRFTVTHLARVNTTVSKRGGINGYTHKGVGGLKLQVNSDPVCYWNDVINWLSGDEDDDGSPLYQIVQLEKVSLWLGVASVNPIYDYNGKPFDGQFIMEAETVVSKRPVRLISSSEQVTDHHSRSQRIGRQDGTGVLDLIQPNVDPRGEIGDSRTVEQL